MLCMVPLPVSGRITNEILLVHPRGELDHLGRNFEKRLVEAPEQWHRPFGEPGILDHQPLVLDQRQPGFGSGLARTIADQRGAFLMIDDHMRSEEHTSELQSLMRISYAVFCLKKKIK